MKLEVKVLFSLYYNFFKRSIYTFYARVHTYVKIKEIIL